jgi:Fe-S cluster assembly ATPase SufC
MRDGITVEEQFDRIVDIYSKIPMDGSVSMLTGSNGSGKSFIRQQLNFRDELKKISKRVVHCSMSIRTQNRGISDAFTHDIEWKPTSINTVDFINCASNSIHGGYLVLDEIEVGCSEETIMGVVAWLNEHLRERIKETLGCMVITHSPYVVRNLKFDHWFNLDGYNTVDEWLGRKIVPVDLEKLQKDSHALFRFVTAQGRE